jgi:polysaccharide biosynthesis protein PslH
VNVLWLARTIPLPANAGDRIYTLEIAAALARTGVHVHYLGLRPDEPVDTALLPANVRWQMIGGGRNPSYSFLTRNLPMAAARHCTPEYRKALFDVLKNNEFDAIVLDHYAMVWALTLVLSMAKTAKLVHLAHDFETDVTMQISKNYRGNSVRRWLLWLNHKRTASTELRFAAACDLIITLTAEDADHFRQLSSQMTFAVLPPGYRKKRRTQRAILSSTPRRVVAVGSFEWLAKQMNLFDFLLVADELFASAGIEFHIIGLVPAPLVSRLPKLRATLLRGDVDDIEAEFDQARGALVFDESGGGFKLKMLDYLFNCVPIFGLSQALSGLPLNVTEFVLHASSMKGLAELVCGSIDDIELLNRCQAGAAAAASGLFQWDDNGERLATALLQTETRRR